MSSYFWTIFLVLPFLAYSAEPQYNDIDKKFALHFQDLSRGLGKFELSTSETGRIYHLAKKSSLFKDYVEPTNQLHQIVKAPLKIEEFVKACIVNRSNKQVTQSFDSVLKRLQKRIDDYCLRFSLKVISVNNSTLEANDFFSYFNRNLEGYFSRNLHTHFYKTIRRMRPDKKSLVSRLVKNSYESGSLKFNRKIFKALNYYPSLAKANASKSIKRMLIRLERRVVKNSISETLLDQEIQSIKDFAKKNISQINTKTLQRYVISLARSLIQKEKGAQARKLLEVGKSSESFSFQEEAKFYSLWSYAFFNHYSGAYQLIERESLLHDFEKFSSKTRYWIAHTIERTGKERLAEQLYQQILSTEPLSFYATLSFKRLAHDSPATTTLQLLQRFRERDNKSKLPWYSLKRGFRDAVARSLVWTDTKQDGNAFQSSLDLLSLKKEDALKSEFLQSVTDKEFQNQIINKVSKLFHQRDGHLQNFKLVHTSLDSDRFDLTDQTLRYLFPLEYLETVSRYNQGLDPLIILSLIRQESAFNPNARSIVGARGLMQLMPATARSMRRSVRVHHLKEPRTNIKIGTKYLKKLVKKYDGDLVKTLSAYNAGETNVRRWDKRLFSVVKDPLKQIEMIPFKETRKYVKLIYRNIFFYRYLSNESLLSKDFKESFKVRISKR